MKIKTLIACFILACAATSCIQDEALNSEAAIDACTGDDVQLANINADSKKYIYMCTKERLYRNNNCRLHCLPVRRSAQTNIIRTT